MGKRNSKFGRQCTPTSSSKPTYGHFTISNYLSDPDDIVFPPSKTTFLALFSPLGHFFVGPAKKKSFLMLVGLFIRSNSNNICRASHARQACLVWETNRTRFSVCMYMYSVVEEGDRMNAAPNVVVAAAVSLWIIARTDTISDKHNRTLSPYFLPLAPFISLRRSP